MQLRFATGCCGWRQYSARKHDYVKKFMRNAVGFAYYDAFYWVHVFVVRLKCFRNVISAKKYEADCIVDFMIVGRMIATVPQKRK